MKTTKVVTGSINVECMKRIEQCLADSKSARSGGNGVGKVGVGRRLCSSCVFMMICLGCNVMM